MGENVLHEADRLTAADRQNVYGPPHVDFVRACRLVNALLAEKLREPLVPTDIPAVMRMIKEARLLHTPDHHDSLVDIAGYARTQQLIVEHDAR